MGGLVKCSPYLAFHINSTETYVATNAGEVDGFLPINEAKISTGGLRRLFSIYNILPQFIFNFRTEKFHQ
jgi:hypothetical protein